MFLPALKLTLFIADESAICIQDWACDCDRSSTQPPEMRKGIFSLTTRQRSILLLSLFVRPALTVNSQLRSAIPETTGQPVPSHYSAGGWQVSAETNDGA